MQKRTELLDQGGRENELKELTTVGKLADYVEKATDR